ncbi:MAG: hypothetical protein ABSH48_25340 [Verrucomicrobiota bacterium]
MLTSTPTDSTASRNASLVNWLPWSVFEISGCPPLAKADVHARMQNSLSRLLDNSHASTSRLHQSMIATRYMYPLAIGTYVMSLHQT